MLILRQTLPRVHSSDLWLACIGRNCGCKMCKQKLQKGGNVIWYGGSFECSLPLLVKSMGSTTFQGFRDPAQSGSAHEVQRIGRGPSIREKKAVQVILAAVALELTNNFKLCVTFSDFSETYFLIWKNNYYFGDANLESLRYKSWRHVTYHCNKIQEPGRSTFREGIGHLNGVLVCYCLVGCHASSVRKKKNIVCCPVYKRFLEITRDY